MENKNINKYHVKKYPNDIIYLKGVPEKAYSKLNISDISGDYLNQYKKKPIENNYILLMEILLKLAPVVDIKIIIIIKWRQVRKIPVHMCLSYRWRCPKLYE